jgi:predicted PurR-regulated permease PerM
MDRDRTLGPQPYAADWGVTTRWIAAIILILAAVVALVMVGRVFSMLALGLLLGYVLYLPIRALSRHTPLSYGGSLALVFVGYLVLLALLLLLVVPPLATSFLNLAENLRAAFQEWGRAILGEEAHPSLFGPWGSVLQQRFTLQEVEQAAAWFLSTAQTVVLALGGTGSAILTLIVIHLLAMFSLIELPPLVHTAGEKLHPAHRREYAILLDASWRKWNRYAGGTGLLAVSVGALNALLLAALGVEGALVVGLIAGLLALIPVIGSLFTVCFIAIVALAQGSTSLPIDPLALALLAVALNLIISTILTQVVFPKIIGSALSLPVVLVIVGVAIGGVVAGPLGMLLSAPVLSLLIDVVAFILAKLRGGDPFPGTPEPAFFRGLFSE